MQVQELLCAQYVHRHECVRNFSRPVAPEFGIKNMGYNQNSSRVCHDASTTFFDRPFFQVIAIGFERTTTKFVQKYSTN